jgi:acetyl esterase
LKEKQVAATLDPLYEQAVALVKSVGINPADPLKMPLSEAREVQQRYFRYLAGDAPEVACVEDHELGTAYGPFTVRLYFPHAERRQPVLVFMRGAGWWAGNLESHDRTMRLLARKSGMVVCGVNYHCAPEARFPTQLNELLATVQWLRASGDRLGLDHESIVLMGESAGATLCALAAAQLALEQVKGLILFYGNLDGPSERSRAYSRWVWSNLLGSDAVPADPAAVPTQADLSGFPTTWLGVGDCDPLIADSRAFAERLERTGIPHDLVVYPGVPHAFVMMSRLYAGADAALDDAALAAREFVTLE